MNEVPNRANHPNRKAVGDTPLYTHHQSGYSPEAHAQLYGPTLSQGTGYSKGALDQMAAEPAADAPAKKVGKVRGMINKIRGRK